MIETLVNKFYKDLVLVEQQPNPYLDKLKDTVDRLDLAERQAANTAMRFRAISDSSPDAVIIMDEETKITYWNDAAEQMFGYGRDNILGQSVAVLMPERFRERHFEKVAELKKNKSRIKAGEGYIGKTAIFDGLRSNGEAFPIKISLSSWRENGNIFFGAHIQDLTHIPAIIDSETWANERYRG